MLPVSVNINQMSERNTDIVKQMWCKKQIFKKYSMSYANHTSILPNI